MPKKPSIPQNREHLEASYVDAVIDEIMGLNGIEIAEVTCVVDASELNLDNPGEVTLHVFLKSKNPKKAKKVNFLLKLVGRDVPGFGDVVPGDEWKTG